jgi:hypothetical protein
MRLTCWVIKDTNTHSECVRIIAFPQQQWLRERTSILRYTYTACLVFLYMQYMPLILRRALKLFISGAVKSVSKLSYALMSEMTTACLAVTYIDYIICTIIYDV